MADNFSPPDNSAPTASQTLPGVDLETALREALRGQPKELDAHLVVLEQNIAIGDTQTHLCCYCLPVDGNGRVRFKPLAEFLRDKVIDYAIPRRAYEEAKAQSAVSGSAAPIANLHEEAKNLFTDLAKTGEGGELLLFAMAEAVFGLTQIICKMSLKTSPKMHYHGSDGVYAEARPDGGLNIYWGESKVYKDVKDAVHACLESLAPFLADDDGEDSARHRDIMLINEFANFNNPALLDGIKRFLDKNDTQSLQTVHCGIALVAFDSGAYPADDVVALADAVAAAIKAELSSWKDAVKARVVAEKLAQFSIKFICVPVPSAEKFREYFLQLLGVK